MLWVSGNVVRWVVLSHAKEIKFLKIQLTNVGLGKGGARWPSDDGTSRSKDKEGCVRDL